MVWCCTSLAYHDRQRIALAKKVLLEAYINGRADELTDDEVNAAVKEEEKNERAIHRMGSTMDDESEDKKESYMSRITRTVLSESCCDAVTEFIVNRPKLRWSLQLLVVMLAGIIYFMYAKEKGSFIEALYWVVISGLAVGFGDLSPSDAPGQLFCFFYIFILVPHVYAVISVMVRTEAPVQSVLGRSLSLELMEILDRDNDGEVTKEEYLGAVLVMLDKTDFDTVDLILEHFSVLDQDGNGVLDKQDILMLSKQKYRPSAVFHSHSSHSSAPPSSPRSTQERSGQYLSSGEESTERAGSLLTLANSNNTFVTSI